MSSDQMPAPGKIKLIKFPPPGQEKTSNARGMPGGGGGCWSFDLTGTLWLHVQPVRVTPLDNKINKITVLGTVYVEFKKFFFLITRRINLETRGSRLLMESWFKRNKRKPFHISREKDWAIHESRKFPLPPSIYDWCAKLLHTLSAIFTTTTETDSLLQAFVFDYAWELCNLYSLTR